MFVYKSFSDKLSFNKNQNKKRKVNDEDDETNNEENTFEEQGRSNKEEQTVICSQCFNELSLAYINFEQAIRYCSNVKVILK
jgi:hypothetical protein